VSEHVQERLSAYLDGELSTGDHAQVDAHLAGCEACARRLEALRAVDGAHRELPVRAPAGYFEAFPARLRRRLKPVPYEHSWRLPTWTWAVAAAALLAVVAPLVLRTPRPAVPRREEEAPPPPNVAPAVPTAPAKEAPRPMAAAPILPRPAEARLPMAAGQAPAEQGVRPPEVRLAGGGRPVTTGGAAQGAPAPLPGEPRGPAPASPAGDALAAASLAAPAPQSEEGKLAGALPERQGALATLARAQSARADEARPEGPTAESFLRKAAPRAEPDPYATLLARPATTAAEARELREAWRSFSRLHPEGARGDESRVRVVEAGARAYRLGSDPTDLTRIREDAREYLDRKDAAQAPRVRGILQDLGLEP
jgi:hypothetical protein